MLTKTKWLACLLLVLFGSGCVTVAEFRKLQREVVDLKRGGGVGGSAGAAPRERVADLGSRLEALERQTEQLGGRVEVAEHRSAQALEEARSARQAAALPPSDDMGAGDSSMGGSADAGGPPVDGADAGSVSQEVSTYRAGYAQWRAGQWESCIDQFREFLQTYPSSAYADDAAYWLADCYFKQGDYKTAILRFDDVVTSYPDGNKAPEALYRQGEALLKLGPGFAKAAGKAFERVVNEYPRSGRAGEAKRQLELLGTG